MTGAVGLFRDEFASFFVRSRHIVSSDSIVLRIGFPMNSNSWGEDFVPVSKFPGSFCVMATTPCQPERFKPYTPIDWSADYMDFLIKAYSDGSVSKNLYNSYPGDQILLKGPREKFKFSFLQNYRNILALAAGTGITPIYQVLKHILRNNFDSIDNFQLIYANRTWQDVLLKRELESIQSQFKALRISHIIEKEHGFVQESDIPEADDSFALVCGPKGFNQMLVNTGEQSNPGLLTKKHYLADQIYTF
jgi:NAD(P)H-flavin reductase